VIAKGGKVDLMMAELFGKVSGYCKGKGGSMHIADVDLGILGANGIVGQANRLRRARRLPVNTKKPTRLSFVSLAMVPQTAEPFMNL
jgi:pyruvate dehydrogenase E1 component alpha subunit